jgi:ABC-2 type transport system permease protein
MANNQQQAMMGCFIFLLPAILLSGIMFPVENIPYCIRWITYLNPIMYAVKNLRYTMLKGGDLMLFWQYCFILFFMAVSISIVGVKKFKATI